MNRLLILFLLLLCFSSQRILAETFIVESTLSTGPGSLRDALEKAAANGNRETDFIHFNITRARDVIIRIPINNPLPDLTSNLVIDGTTQPGVFLGASNAKVCITIEGLYNGSDPIILFNARDASNIKIYGLFLKGNVANPLGSRPTVFTAINLQQTQNMVIGSPDKGNVISGWTKAIHEMSGGRTPATSNITISSNIFGLDTDGVSTTFVPDRSVAGPANNTHSVYFDKCANGITIGGADNTYGNIFNSGTDIHIEGTLNSDGRVSITYNKFGVDINGDNINSNSAAAINVLNIDCAPLNYAIPASPIITNNYIGGKSRTTGINATDLRTNTDIFDNILGYEDRTGSPPRDAFYGAAIRITRTYQSHIRNNIIRYWLNGAILMDAIVSCNVSKNSTYCNKKRAIEIRNWTALIPPPRKQPFAYINRIDNFRSIVSGTSLPDNTIELFYNENCPTCEGKTWFATVQSDAQGNWTYNGPLNGDNVIATASDIFSSTSEYSMPKLDQAGVVISPVTCAGGYGSICGLKILSGTKWRWEDQAGNVVGYDTCLRMVPAGRYFFKLAVGSSCEESFAFLITDVSPTIDESGVNITPARCALANGTLCGMRIRNGVRQQWEDELGNVVSTNLCFNNARPGRYRLKLEGQQNCIVYSSYFQVPNKVPRIDAVNATIVNPSCGRNNGSITGIQLFDMDFSTRGWYDDAGVLVSSSLDLRNAAPGRYKLVVKDNSGACGDSTAYFTLSIVPPPAINTTNVQVTNASCGNSNGSVRGITFSNITGTLNYWWVNQDGAIVSNTADLLNAAPGNYKLKAKDGSNCDTLFSAVYTIADRGSVAIDASSVNITATGCTKRSGAITGIRVSGADVLQWRNTVTGSVVGSTADISALAAGNYQLTVTNTTYNCTLKSAVYTVSTAPPLQLEVLEDKVKQASCAQNNGSIELSKLSNNTALFTFKWLKDSTTFIGTGLSISDLSPATYYCIATDTNGCEKAFYKKAIAALPLPTLNENNVSIAADTCEFKSGRISGITANSDAGNIDYSWRTATDQVIGKNAVLSGMPAGDYYLLVTDGRGCTVKSKTYNIPAVNTSFAAPRYTASYNISRNSNLRLAPASVQTGTYTLYDRNTGQVVDQNTTGIFNLVNIDRDRDLYVKLTTGPCSSMDANIKIKVFDETSITVPNAFSPNGDGTNDEFRIQVTGLFNLNYLRVYNRYGQMVHESRDLSLPWKGTMNGTSLPVGTYYWVLEGVGMHNALIRRSGSITLIR